MIDQRILNAAVRRNELARYVSEGATLEQAAAWLGVPHMRAKKMWRRIREDLGAQAK